MERKLLLSSQGFPSKYADSGIAPCEGVTQQDFVEKEILKSVNKFNPKLKLTDIEYLDIKTQFPSFLGGMYAGVIVEDDTINKSEEQIYKDSGYFTWKNNDEYYSRRIIVYVFLSDTVIKGRNIISQSIFPEVIDYMNAYYESPSYTIANCPIYFLNILNQEVTAQTIIKQFFGMMVSDIEYIEVFNKNSVFNDRPQNMEDYIAKIALDYTPTNTTYKCEHYSIDFAEKKIAIKTDRLVLNDYIEYKDITKKMYKFKGSSEKFYWMEILPIIMFGVSCGYSIDNVKLVEFCTENEKLFAANDIKFARFKMLNKYIQKII